MDIVCRSTRALLLGAILLLPLVVAGCGGDGGGGGGGGPTEATITVIGCDPFTYAADGIICIDFTLTGPAGVYDALAQFIATAGSAPEDAYAVPPALAQQLGITSNYQNIVLSFDGQVVNGRFCWFAGADLGFLAASGLQIYLTPLDAGTTNPAGPVATGCPGLNYTGGGATEASSGAGVGTSPLVGRAGHCGTNVGGKSIVIAGGYTAQGMSLPVYQDAKRFTLDLNNFTHSANGSPLNLVDPRRDHACSFFLDTVTGAIKMLSCGGHPGSNTPTTTAEVYCFSPTEQMLPTLGNMNVARRGHTATWIPSNKVVVIGGENGSGVQGSIEIYDPTTDSFQLLTTSLNLARKWHTATLLASGKVLVAGGLGTGGSGTALQAEIFDPATSTVMPVSGPTVDHVFHTATRLANGWVLLAGGNMATSFSTISSLAMIFQPELGGMGQFTATIPLMSSPRSYHAATLLGNGNTILTGGYDANMSATSSAELFLPQTLTFTPTIPMLQQRAEHSSSPTDCGAVGVFGGLYVSGGAAVFLDSIEVFPFQNTNPVVAFTATAPATAGKIYLDASFTDADGDGGYALIRYRPGGMGMFRLCTIDEQNPSSAGAGFPSMQISGMPSQALPYAFRWNYTADGLTSGQTAEIEILPVGATLGTPVRWLLTIP